MKKIYNGRLYTARPATIDNIDLGCVYCIDGIIGYADGLTGDDVIFLVDESEKTHKIKLSATTDIQELISEKQLIAEKAKEDGSLLKYRAHGYIIVESFEDILLPLSKILEVAKIHISDIKKYYAASSLNMTKSGWEFDRMVYYLKLN